MDISRRNFLKAGAVASALGLGGAALAAALRRLRRAKAKRKRRIPPNTTLWHGLVKRPI